MTKIAMTTLQSVADLVCECVAGGLLRRYETADGNVVLEDLACGLSFVLGCGTVATDVRVWAVRSRGPLLSMPKSQPREFTPNDALAYIIGVIDGAMLSRR